MGAEAGDGRSSFDGPPGRAALPMDGRRGYGHGDGFDSSDPDDRKPVAMFGPNRDALNGKELSFDVIR